MRTADFAFGGYLITSRAPRPSKGADLLPPQLVTASGCLAPFFPDVWAFESPRRTPKREEWTRAFGLEGAASVEPLCVALLDSREILWARFIQSDSAVRKLLHAIGPTFEPIVLGLALHGDLVSEFADEESIGAREAETLVGALRRNALPPDDGVMLGFEPLGFEYGAADAHSWICNGLERPFFDRTQARPNSYGLIDDFELARTFCVDVTREELGEPVLWLPWALIDYSRAFGLSGAAADESDR